MMLRPWDARMCRPAMVCVRVVRTSCTHANQYDTWHEQYSMVESYIIYQTMHWHTTCKCVCVCVCVCLPCLCLRELYAQSMSMHSVNSVSCSALLHWCTCDHEHIRIHTWHVHMHVNTCRRAMRAAVMWALPLAASEKAVTVWACSFVFGTAHSWTVKRPGTLVIPVSVKKHSSRE